MSLDNIISLAWDATRSLLNYVPGSFAVPERPSLLAAASQFLTIAFAGKIYVSLVKDVAAGWSRGIDFDFTSSGSTFAGLASWSFTLNAALSITVPEACEPGFSGSLMCTEADVARLLDHAANPLSQISGGMAITGDVHVSAFNLDASFVGNISKTDFFLSASANITLAGIYMDLSLDVSVSAGSSQLACSGALDIGPFGSVAMAGKVTPNHYSMAGSIAVAPLGDILGAPQFNGALSASSTSTTGVGAWAVANMGFLGSALNLTGSVSAGAISLSATGSFDPLSIISTLTDAILNTIMGTTGEGNVFVKPLKDLLTLGSDALAVDDITIKVAASATDATAGAEVSVSLTLLGERRTLKFTIGTPAGRRRRLGAFGGSCADFSSAADFADCIIGLGSDMLMGFLGGKFEKSTTIALSGGTFPSPRGFGLNVHCDSIPPTSQWANWGTPPMPSCNMGWDGTAYTLDLQSPISGSITVKFKLTGGEGQPTAVALSGELSVSTGGVQVVPSAIFGGHYVPPSHWAKSVSASYSSADFKMPSMSIKLCDIVPALDSLSFTMGGGTYYYRKCFKDLPGASFFPCFAALANPCFDSPPVTAPFHVSASLKELLMCDNLVLNF